MKTKPVTAGIVGGKLQGMEALYLARKAGWNTLLMDRKSADMIPASRLFDELSDTDHPLTHHEFIQLIPGNDGNEEIIKGILEKTDWVIPAVENRKSLEQWQKETLWAGVPFAFDHFAYDISSSKIKSDILFKEIGIPAPLPWPECSFPVVAKPTGGSGSKGVNVFHDPGALNAFFNGSIPTEGWVIQEYLEGPSFSLEVVGVPGNYTPLQVTDLEMDAQYDCKRVSAPTRLEPRLIKEFEDISVAIARALNLKGVMDVEVILHKGGLKVLEIDARLPSQTPTVVYHSTGINILELLKRCFVMDESVPPLSLPVSKWNKGVVYEHINVSPADIHDEGSSKIKNKIEICGEGIMTRFDSQSGPQFEPLRWQSNFFGADEAITNYRPGKREWVATLINTGNDRREAWEKRNNVIQNILEHKNY